MLNQGTSIKCPYCGAEFEAPSGYRYVVCPYCGTTIETGTGAKQETFIYPIRVEEQEAYQLAIIRASQLPGAPSDIAEASSYIDGSLHYVPLYVCSARAVVRGCEAAQEEIVEAFIAAPSAVPGLYREYRFPAAGREPYDPEKARRGVFHQVTTSHEDQCKRLEARVSARALREAALARCNGDLETETKLLGIAHYPVWLIKYQYPSSQQHYRALVDAVDANVLYLEYPIPLEKRALLLGGAATALGTSIALAIIATIATHSPLYLASWLPGVAAAAPFLTKAVSRIGRYELRKASVEETVVEKQNNKS